MTAYDPLEQRDIERRAWAARWATQQAGALAWRHFQRGVGVESKADRTPVTVADREAEELLRNVLRREFPADGFLGEEYGEEQGSSGFRWIIDPIDATWNFVRGIPIFGTLTGLEFQGKMVAGCVAMPALGQIYYAHRGAGAFRNDQPIRVSDIGILAEGQMLYSSVEYFDKAGQTDRYLDLARRFRRTRGFGDFFGFLLVADGSAEIMIDPVVSPWDVAALQPIVEEAGGVFSDWFGERTPFGHGCVCANPAVHAQFLSLVHGSANEPQFAGRGSHSGHVDEPASHI